MCKYCRHLKDLKNRDKAYYESLIKSWQRTCARQEKLLIQALFYLEAPFSGCFLPLSFVDRVSDLIKRIKEELRKDTVHD